MDLYKITDSALSKFAEDIASKKIDSFNLSQQYPESFKQSNEYVKLMEYSNILLETYHQELKKELAKSGIEI